MQLKLPGLSMEEGLLQRFLAASELLSQVASRRMGSIASRMPKTKQPCCGLWSPGRCELIDSLGPLVEGYTMERRLASDLMPPILV